MGWGGIVDESCLGGSLEGAHMRPIKGRIRPDTTRPLPHPNPSTHLDPIIPIGHGCTYSIALWRVSLIQVNTRP